MKIGSMATLMALSLARCTAFTTQRSSSLKRTHMPQYLSKWLSPSPHSVVPASRLTRSMATDAESDTEPTIETATTDTSIYAQESESLSKLTDPFLQILRDRGFLHQCTNILDLDATLSSTEAITSAYLGFDATADSLHVGSLLQIMILRHFQKSGHKPIVLLGGATSKVGDPTGKDESRKLLTDADIQHNIRGIGSVFQKFLTFEEGSSPSTTSTSGSSNPATTDAVMVNNDDWFSTINYLDFLREYGTKFTINRMMSFESVKQRLDREAPFSFLEFNYMILQSYDFLELSRRFGVTLQLGGADQWGNMVCGTELGRKCDGKRLFALTAPLITTSDGKKMGKSEGGAIWLNKDKLSEYDYWQFWRNTSDDDVVRFLKLFTELPLGAIGDLEQLTGADINTAKIVLADEATALLHGSECLDAIHQTIESMFTKSKKNSSAQNTDSLPRIFVSATQMEGENGGVRFVDLFLELKLATSKKDAKRLISGGGARLGDVKITDELATLTASDFEGVTEVTLKAGKKRAGVVELK